jgi:hypothetical protein
MHMTLLLLFFFKAGVTCSHIQPLNTQCYTQVLYHTHKMLCACITLMLVCNVYLYDCVQWYICIYICCCKKKFKKKGCLRGTYCSEVCYHGCCEATTPLSMCQHISTPLLRGDRHQHLPFCSECLMEVSCICSFHFTPPPSPAPHNINTYIQSVLLFFFSFFFFPALLA